MSPIGLDEAAKKRAEPYTRIVEVQLQMRRETVDLVKKAVSGAVKSYVLVNDRAEGNGCAAARGQARTLTNRP